MPWNTKHSQWSISFVAAMVYRSILLFCPSSSHWPICNVMKIKKLEFYDSRPSTEIRTRSGGSLHAPPPDGSPSYAMCFGKLFRRPLYSRAESRNLPARIFHFRRQSSAVFHFVVDYWMVCVAVDLVYHPRSLDACAMDLENQVQCLPSVDRILHAPSTNSVPGRDLKIWNQSNYV